jgi:hypothetical protein
MFRGNRTALLLLAVATLAAPAAAWLAASSEGLLAEVLTAYAARARTRDNPDRRDRESRALELANLAAQNPALRSPDAPTAKAAFGTYSGPPVPKLGALVDHSESQPMAEAETLRFQLSGISNSVLVDSSFEPRLLPRRFPAAIIAVVERPLLHGPGRPRGPPSAVPSA